MDAVKAMLSRRSIRSYTTQSVQDEMVTGPCCGSEPGGRDRCFLAIIHCATQ